MKFYNSESNMAREYDHLFKLLIIGDSGKSFYPTPYIT